MLFRSSFSPPRLRRATPPATASKAADADVALAAARDGGFSPCDSRGDDDASALSSALSGTAEILCSLVCESREPPEAVSYTHLTLPTKA